MATDNQQSTLNVAGSLVGIGVVGLLWFIAWALVFYQIPEANSTSFSTLLGIISGNTGLVVGFYFGSSLSNKKATDTISTLANTAAAAQTALTPPPDGDKVVQLDPGHQATIKAKPEAP